MESPTNYGAPAPIVLKPGYASSFANAAKQFKAFLPSLLLVAVVFNAIIYLLSTVFRITSRNYLLIPQSNTFQENFWWVMANILLFDILLGPVEYGYALATLKAARGEKPSVIDLFRPFKQFFTVIFSAILSGLIVGLGFILLIIPGIFFLCRLVFVPCLVVDQKKSVFGAIRGSWNITRGHFWHIFLLGLTFIVAVYILGAVGYIALIFFVDTFGIWLDYLIFTIIIAPGLYMFLIWGSLYHAIRLERAKNTNGTPQ